MKKNHTELQIIGTEQDNLKFSNVSEIIESRKFNAIFVANSQIVLMFWEIGKYINSAILGMERAEYGKKIVVTLSRQLSWSHFLALLSLKTMEEKLYYATETSKQLLGVRDLRHIISRKSYERREI